MKDIPWNYSLVPDVVLFLIFLTVFAVGVTVTALAYYYGLYQGRYEELQDSIVDEPEEETHDGAQ